MSKALNSATTYMPMKYFHTMSKHFTSSKFKLVSSIKQAKLIHGSVTIWNNYSIDLRF